MTAPQNLYTLGEIWKRSAVVSNYEYNIEMPCYTALNRHIYFDKNVYIYFFRVVKFYSRRSKQFPDSAKMVQCKTLDGNG